jgi:hypothetical protein
VAKNRSGVRAGVGGRRGRDAMLTGGSAAYQCRAVSIHQEARERRCRGCVPLDQYGFGQRGKRGGVRLSLLRSGQLLSVANQS